MALSDIQITEIQQTLGELDSLLENYADYKLGTLHEENMIDPPVGTASSLISNHQILVEFKAQINDLFIHDDDFKFRKTIPIELEDLEEMGLVPNKFELESEWRANTHDLLEGFYEEINSLTPNAAAQLDSNDTSVYKPGETPSGFDDIVADAQEIAELCRQVVNQLGHIAFGRKNLGPPYGPSSEAEIIMVDEDLEISLAPVLEETQAITHYIGLLEPPGTSDGARSDPYLPVRYAPHYHSPPLNNGWDDEGYLVLNQENKLVKPEGHFEVDGIEVPLGLGIYIVEFVLSNTGMWVGFVPTVANNENFLEYTKEETRVLYTRPK